MQACLATPSVQFELFSGDLVTYEPVLDGPEGRPTLEPDAVWPVLARLPWVGDPAAMREPPRASYAAPSAEPAVRRELAATANLRIADTPAEASRAYVDRPHVPPARQPAAIAGSVAEERRQREAAPPQRRHRIDGADARHIEALAATVRRHTLPINESNTLAGQIFQWHAATTPYAGVVLTFLLAFFAGLLYWFTMGRPQATPAAGESSAPIWTSESLDPTTVARESMNGAAASPAAEEFSWSQRDAKQLLNSETTKLETPPLGEAFTEATNAAAAAPLAPPTTEPAPAPANEAPVAATTPTPPAAAPSSCIYPTTPYPAIDAGLIPAATLSPSVAQRPVDGALPQPASR